MCTDMMELTCLATTIICIFYVVALACLNALPQWYNAAMRYSCYSSVHFLLYLETCIHTKQVSRKFKSGIMQISL